MEMKTTAERKREKKLQNARDGRAMDSTDSIIDEASLSTAFSSSSSPPFEKKKNFLPRRPLWPHSRLNDDTPV